jgi:hypothetical protein
MVNDGFAPARATFAQWCSLLALDKRRLICFTIPLGLGTCFSSARLALVVVSTRREACSVKALCDDQGT